MNARSIATGNGPDVQALVADWTASRFIVASVRTERGWLHGRAEAKGLTSAHTKTQPVDGQVIVSSRPTAPQEIGELFADGYAVESVQIGRTWVNRAVVRAGAR